VRHHLGHHFYGAGNLGDDFMLAGFLAGLRAAGGTDDTLSCAIPFALPPVQARFPEIHWHDCAAPARHASIAAAATWLGLGGSPFQHALSRWFLDHLLEEAETCRRLGRRMFYLGIGVQTATEAAAPEVRRLCAQSAGIWTRDAASAERLRACGPAGPLSAATDLAHAFFAATPPPAATAGRCALVANFDFGTWPGQTACLAAVAALGAREHVWLAQESRALPGAERTLHSALPAADRARWSLVAPELPGAPLAAVLARWPSAEWLVTSRYHAALAGAWAGSKVVVIGLNEKLRGVALQLGLPCIPPDASVAQVSAALALARPVPAATLAVAADSARGAIRDWRLAAS
jgi:hypothetical protein